MSHSTSLNLELGSLQLVDGRLETGSASSQTPRLTPAPVALADAAATLTATQVSSALFVMTPTASRVVTLPTAALLAGVLNRVGESLDLSVLNLGGTGLLVTLAAGSGGSVVGLATVAPVADSNGASLFRLRMTSVTASSEAYVVYRLG
jgi:hypothetical protein